jgi:hypothetical protein
LAKKNTLRLCFFVFVFSCFFEFRRFKLKSPETKLLFFTYFYFYFLFFFCLSLSRGFIFV